MGIKLIKKTNEAAYTAIKNPEQATFIIDCGTPEKAKELNDAFYKVAFVEDGWKPNKEVIGGELILSWNVGPFFTACVDPCDKAAAWCEEWLRNHGGSVLEGKKSDNKRYTFTWWDSEPTYNRRPTTKADLKNSLHKEIIFAVDDAEALKVAVEYLCGYISEDSEDIGDTPEEIWDYFNGDWGAGDPIPMVLKQGSRVVKDSGFKPKESDDDW